MCKSTIGGPGMGIMGNITFDTIISDVKKQNFVKLPFDLSHKELVAAAEAFFDFLTLPDSVKNQFYFKVDPDSPRTHVGYIRRHDTMGSADNKEFFHYHAAAPERFKELAAIEEPKVKAFFTAADKVFQAGVHAMNDLLVILEDGIPGIHKRIIPEGEHPAFYLRFLKYDAKGEGEFLARGHYDSGGMTLALAESAPGLRIGKNDKDLVEVEHERNHVIFMPAFRFRDLSDNSDFTPTWHDVVQRGEDTYDTDTARWAIVLFADSSHVNRESSEEVHTPKYYD